jgi:hypothetical protein
MPGGGKFQSAISSGEKTSDTIIHTGACRLTGIQIITDGTNDATVILYDNTSAAGKVLFQGTVEGGAAIHYGGRNWTFPVSCNIGIYLDLTGTGASAIVEYVPK